MYHLKLVKALSYSGIVMATKKNPDVFVEDKATADAAVATGYFKFVGDEENPDGSKGKKTGKKLEEMTVQELETFSVYKGISLKGLSKKADIIAKLKEGLDEEETENEVDYGSPTMVEQQEE